MADEYRIEKSAVPAVISMANGAKVTGHFFATAGGSVGRANEDARDILNATERFFPFRVSGGDAPGVHLVNRRHVAVVRLLDAASEGRNEASTGITPRKFATLMLSTGETVSGVLRVAMPSGQSRISDYANSEETFCYVESPDGLSIVNLDHVSDILTFMGAMGEEE